MVYPKAQQLWSEVYVLLNIQYKQGLVYDPWTHEQRE